MQLDARLIKKRWIFGFYSQKEKIFDAIPVFKAIPVIHSVITWNSQNYLKEKRAFPSHCFN